MKRMLAIVVLVPLITLASPALILIGAAWGIVKLTEWALHESGFGEWLSRV